MLGRHQLDEESAVKRLGNHGNVFLCLTTQKEDDETMSTMNHSILLQERPIKQTVTR